MPRYVAFLRAINVGGHVVKMDRLRSLFEEAGFSKVETFIASGNVLFDTTSKIASAIEKKIEKHLEQALGYEVVTFVRPVSELESILATHPYGEENAKGVRLHIGFLKGPTGADVQKKMKSLETEQDEFHFHGSAVYWLCRTGISDSKFSGPLFERSLGARATFRNVNTIRRIAAKHG